MGEPNPLLLASHAAERMLSRIYTLGGIAKDSDLDEPLERDFLFKEIRDLQSSLERFEGIDVTSLLDAAAAAHTPRIEVFSVIRTAEDSWETISHPTRCAHNAAFTLGRELLLGLCYCVDVEEWEWAIGGGIIRFDVAQRIPENWLECLEVLARTLDANEAINPSELAELVLLERRKLIPQQPHSNEWPIVTTDPPLIAINGRSHDLKPEAAEWLLYLVNLRGEYGSVRGFEKLNDRENVKPDRLMKNLPKWILEWYESNNRGTRIRRPVSRA